MFVIGETYRRRTLHMEHGSQRQGGISTPKGKPFIFLFTGDSGGTYGYKGWLAYAVYMLSSSIAKALNLPANRRVSFIGMAGRTRTQDIASEASQSKHHRRDGD
jgi:hypothetical protein